MNKRKSIPVRIGPMWHPGKRRQFLFVSLNPSNFPKKEKLLSCFTQVPKSPHNQDKNLYVTSK